MASTTVTNSGTHSLDIFNSNGNEQNKLNFTNTNMIPSYLVAPKLAVAVVIFLVSHLATAALVHQSHGVYSQRQASVNFDQDWSQALQTCQESGRLRDVEIAVEADSDFCSFHNGREASMREVNKIIRQATYPFITQLCLRLVVVWERIHCSRTTDPLRNFPNDGSQALNMYRDYWRRNHASVHKDVSVLFTGKSIGGGIANFRATCSPTRAHFLVPQRVSPIGFAHELSHIFGGDHLPAGEFGIMHPGGAIRGNPFLFKPVTLDAMNNDITRFGSCLTQG